jgi:hypothetical protein
MEMKHSENYSTAACSVFVKLTCDQNTKVIEEARDVAHKMAVTFAKEGYEHARYILDGILGRVPQEPETANHVAPKKRKLTAKADDPEPDRGQKRIPVMKGKPVFRKG